ncbi:adenosine receptor A3-like [Montipora foliosa]|uniref:adenosine receptor A3-like n=1 Tax=Montipora foliosa TaxID=591990 RepID=UPI0035F1001B
MRMSSQGAGNMTDYGRRHIPLDTIPSMVFMVFILVINGCVVLLGCSSNMRSTSNILLASLAVSDFLVGFVGIPLLVACSATYETPLCLSSNIFFKFISLSTVLHITIITCDRYLYITWALRYRDIVQRRRVCAVLALIWCISLLTSLVRLSWTLDVNIHTAKEDLALVQEHEITYLLFKFFVFFLSPLILMIILDVRMVLLLRKQYQKIVRENLPAEFMRREKKLQVRQKRVVLRCILLLFLYSIFWLPYFILEIIQQNHPQIPEDVVIIIYYLRLCPPLFNPLAYALRKQDLKSKTKGIFCKVSNYTSKDIWIKMSTDRSLSSSAHV